MSIHQSDKKTISTNNQTQQQSKALVEGQKETKDQRKRRFYDDSKIVSVLQRFATLEDAAALKNTDVVEPGESNSDPTNSKDTYDPQNVLNNDPDLSQHNNGAAISQFSNLTDRDFANQSASKTFLQRVEKALIGRIFQVNYMLLKHQAVKVSLYQLLLLIGFLQQVFFILYQQEIHDEFYVVKAVDSSASLMDTLEQGNSQTGGDLYNISGSGDNQTANDIQLQTQDFLTLDFSDYLKFLLLQMAQSRNNASTQYLIIYISLTTLFFGLIALLVGLSSHIFDRVKTETLKDGNKLVLQILSVVMICFITILQIPFTLILLEAYVCHEPTDNDFSVPHLTCGSTLQRVLSIFSGVTLVFYYSFLMTQFQLYTSCNPDADLPWSGFNTRLSFVNMIVKFVLTSTFVFENGDSNMQGIVQLFVAFLQMNGVYQRCTKSLIFTQSVHWATITYETLLICLLLSIPIHKLTSADLTVSTMIMLAAASILFTSLLVVIQRRSQLKLLTQEGKKKLTTESDYEQYLVLLYLLISANEKIYFMIVEGVFQNHIECCERKICRSANLAQSIDGVKDLKKELRQAKIVAQLDEESLLMARANTEGIGSASKEGQTPENGNLSHILQRPSSDQDKSDQSIELKGSVSAELIIQNGGSPLNRRRESGFKNFAHSSQRKLSQMFQLQNISIITPPPNGVEQKAQLFPSFQNKDMVPPLTLNLQQQASMKNLKSQQSQKSVGRLNTLNNSKFDMHVRPKSYYDVSGFKEQEHFWIHDFDYEYLQKKYFKFQANQVLTSVEKMPKCINLRLLSSYVQRNRINNHFKSLFDLMTSDTLSPNLQQRFMIFRGKIEIQQALIHMHDKNSTKPYYVDADQVFQYEKLYMRFQFDEYLAVHAAIKFWKELMHKQLKASVVQARGMEIARQYQKILENEAQMRKIYPEDIKLLYRMGLFQIRIMNNEYDGRDRFNQALIIYHSKILGKKRRTALSEIDSFGTNSGAAIIMVAANAKCFGTVLHANDELEYQLGFKREDLLNRNVNIIMPDIIKQFHNQYIQRYLDSGKQKVIETLLEMFPVNKKGYCKLMNLLIKIHTQINGRILFVGLLQRTKEFTAMDEPKGEFQKLPQSYILTDSKGYLVTTSENLYFELGLSSTLFNYESQSFSSMIHIDKICQNIRDEEVEQAITREGGMVLQFDTRDIINTVDLEKFDNLEIEEVNQNIGLRQAFVQMVRQDLKFTDQHMCIYRVILIGQNRYTGFNDSSRDSSNMFGGSFNLQKSMDSSDYMRSKLPEGENHSLASVKMQANTSISQVSFSSSASSTSALNVLKTFKQSLNDKTPPGNQRSLNRFIIFAMLVIITLTIVEFVVLKQGIEDMDGENWHNFNSERRTLNIQIISSNIRSLMNVGNKLEYERFELEALNRFEKRFEYLARLVEVDGKNLQEIHEFMTQQRVDDDAGTNVLQQKFEYNPITLYRINNYNQIEAYYLPYRVAFFNFLNEILNVNEEVEDDLNLPIDLLTYDKLDNSTRVFPEMTSLQKTAFFLQINGLRSLRKRSEEATQFQQETSFSNLGKNPYLIMMVVSIFLVLCSIVLIIIQIIKIERLQTEILSLYALLDTNHVRMIYEQCHDYMSIIDQETLITRVIGAEQPVVVSQSARMAITPTVDGLESKAILVTDPSMEGKLKILDAKPSGNFKPLGQKNSNKTREHRKSIAKEYVDSEEEFKDPTTPMAFKNPFLQPLGIGKNLQYLQTGTFNQQQHQIKESTAYNRIKRMNLYEGIARQIDQEIKDMDSAALQKNMVRIGGSSGIQSQKKNPWSMSIGSGGEEGRQLSPSIHSQLKNKEQQIKHQAKKDKLKKRFGLTDGALNVKGSQGEKGGKDAKRRKSKFVKQVDKEINMENIDSSRVDLDKNEDEEGIDDESTFSDLDEHTEKNSRFSKTQKKQKALEGDYELANRRGTTEMQMNEVDEQEHIEARKAQFQRTFNTETIGRKIGIILLGFVLAGYFIQVFCYQTYFEDEIASLIGCIPIIFNRLRFISLTYSLLRERIIFNNSLSSFESAPASSGYGHNLDLYYLSQSFENEQAIQRLRLDYPYIAEGLINQLAEVDSQNFCSNIIGQTKSDGVAHIQDLKSQNYKASDFVTYQTEISTIMTACEASFHGNLVRLQNMHYRGVNLSLGDWDYRTPLQYAVRGGKIAIVRYLLDVGANPNMTDRWGATPLNFANQSREISNLLLQRYATRGQEVVFLEEPNSFDLSDNDQRLYYAAQHNDVKTAEIMFYMGWHVNKLDIDGRTPVHVAAAEGHFEMVSFLASKGADLSYFDYRGRCSMDEAEENGFIDLHIFIDSIISDSLIKQNCDVYGQGLLKLGLSSTLATFHRKFSDISIKVEQGQGGLNGRLNILRGPSFLNGVEQHEDNKGSTSIFETMQLYWGFQELYVDRIIQSTESKIVETFQTFKSNYQEYTLILFICFLSIEVVTLVYLRRRMMRQMLSDIFQSRGILNLIPNHVIDNNKMAVEAIIKKLKD